jgi:hypothetical protein
MLFLVHNMTKWGTISSQHQKWPKVPCTGSRSEAIIIILRLSASTIIRFYNSLILQFSASTILCFYNSPLLKFSTSMILRFYNSLHHCCLVILKSRIDQPFARRHSEHTGSFGDLMQMLFNFFLCN